LNLILARVADSVDMTVYILSAIERLNWAKFHMGFLNLLQQFTSLSNRFSFLQVAFINCIWYHVICNNITKRY